MKNDEFIKKYLEIISEEKNTEDRFEDKKVTSVEVNIPEDLSENDKEKLEKIKNFLKSLKNESLMNVLKKIAIYTKGISISTNNKNNNETNDKNNEEKHENQKREIEVNLKEDESSKENEGKSENGEK